MTGGQTLSHHTDHCSFYLRLDSAEKVCRGSGYESIAWSKGTKPSLAGEVREGSPGEECVN